MTSHRSELKKHLRQQYDTLRADGMSKGEAIDALMDYQVQVKQLFTDQTVIQFIFNASYGLGSDRQREVNKRTGEVRKIKNLKSRKPLEHDSPKGNLVQQKKS